MAEQNEAPNGTAADPLAVECPRCGAAPGARCTRLGSDTPIRGVHALRDLAVRPAAPAPRAPGADAYALGVLLRGALLGIGPHHTREAQLNALDALVELAAVRAPGDGGEDVATVQGDEYERDGTGCWWGTDAHGRVPVGARMGAVLDALKLSRAGWSHARGMYATAKVAQEDAEARAAHLTGESAAWQQKWREADARAERMAAALRRHGHHLPECRYPCDCGLRAALAGEPPEAEVADG